jgi:tape measure domain-containing protein
MGSSIVDTISLSGVDQYVAGLGRISRAHGQFQKEAGKSDRMGAIGAGLVIGGGATIGMLGKLGMASLKASGDMDMTRQSFSKLLGSVSAGNAKIKELQTFAARTPFSMTGLVDSSKQLLAMGFQGKELIPVMNSLGNAMAGLGGGDDVFQRVIYNLGQIRSQGKATAVDLRQFAIAGINVAEVMEKATGKKMSLGQMTGMDGEEFIRNFLKGLDMKFGGLLDKQSKTLPGQLNNMSDAVDRLKITLGDLFNQDATGFLKGVNEKLEKLENWIKRNPNLAKNLFKILGIGAGAAVLGGGYLKYKALNRGLGQVRDVFDTLTGTKAPGGVVGNASINTPLVRIRANVVYLSGSIAGRGAGGGAGGAAAGGVAGGAAAGAGSALVFRGGVPGVNIPGGGRWFPNSLPVGGRALPSGAAPPGTPSLPGPRGSTPSGGFTGPPIDIDVTLPAKASRWERIVQALGQWSVRIPKWIPRIGGARFLPMSLLSSPAAKLAGRAMPYAAGAISGVEAYQDYRKAGWSKNAAMAGGIGSGLVVGAGSFIAPWAALAGGVMRYGANRYYNEPLERAAVRGNGLSSAAMQRAGSDKSRQAGELFALAQEKEALARRIENGIWSSQYQKQRAEDLHREAETFRRVAQMRRRAAQAEAKAAAKAASMAQSQAWVDEQFAAKTAIADRNYAQNYKNATGELPNQWHYPKGFKGPKGFGNEARDPQTEEILARYGFRTDGALPGQTQSRPVKALPGESRAPVVNAVRRRDDSTRIAIDLPPGNGDHMAQEVKYNATAPVNLGW